jgi:AbrB family looped-hinge helix DNA binding protein
MADFFRVKIVSKRQVTLPQLLLERLHLAEGDELEFEVDEGEIVRVRPLKLVPTNYFSPELLARLNARAEGIDSGRAVERVPPVNQSSAVDVYPADATAAVAVYEDSRVGQLTHED